MQITGAKNPSDRAGVHVEKLISRHKMRNPAILLKRVAANTPLHQSRLLTRWTVVAAAAAGAAAASHARRGLELSGKGMGRQWERYCWGYRWREMWRRRHYVVVRRGVRVVIDWGAWEWIHVERRVLRKRRREVFILLWGWVRVRMRSYNLYLLCTKERRKVKQDRPNSLMTWNMTSFVEEEEAGVDLWYYFIPDWTGPFPAPTSPNGYFKCIFFSPF